MWKALLWLVAIVFAITLIMEYWIWFLLALLVLGAAYYVCIRKGFMKPLSLKRLTQKTPDTSLLPAPHHRVAYQYENVRFYPPKELIAKVGKQNLHAGASIFLKQEPENKYDDRAVALYVSGSHIGYLLRGTLQDMANDYIEQGLPIKATLVSLSYSEGEYHGYIDLEFYRDAAQEIPEKKKRKGYSDIDIKAIAPTDPSVAACTPLAGKNVVFSGVFKRPLEEMMQIAVDGGATLKTRVSKSTDYLVVGKQNEMFLDENGMSSKEATASKLIQQGCKIVMLNEEEFLSMANTLDF